MEKWSEPTVDTRKVGEVGRCKVKYNKYVCER